MTDYVKLADVVEGSILLATEAIPHVETGTLVLVHAGPRGLSIPGDDGHVLLADLPMDDGRLVGLEMPAEHNAPPAQDDVV